MQTERDEFAQSLPWAAELLPGWTADKKLHSDYAPEKPDGPGYIPEQAERHRALHPHQTP